VLERNTGVSALAQKVEQAGWSTEFADDANRRQEVTKAMADIGALLPSTAQQPWTTIAGRFVATPSDGP
jgi:hypothetical protein